MLFIFSFQELISAAVCTFVIDVVIVVVIVVVVVVVVSVQLFTVLDVRLAQGNQWSPSGETKHPLQVERKGCCPIVRHFN